MAEPLSLDILQHLDRIVAELDRELAQRARVYPRWVEAGKLLPQTAEERVALLREARALIHGLRGIGGVVGAQVEVEGPPLLIDLLGVDGERRRYRLVREEEGR